MQGGAVSPDLSFFEDGGALVSTGMMKPRLQAEAPLASLKAANS